MLLSAGDTEAVRVANGGALLLRIRQTVQGGFRFFGRGITADGAPGDQHGIAGRGGGGQDGAEKGKQVTGAAGFGVGGKLNLTVPPPASAAVLPICSRAMPTMSPVRS